AIKIDSEVLQVTAGAGTNTWTVARGFAGTTAAAHNSNATVNAWDPITKQVAVSLYDPKDPMNQGYRGYIGYAVMDQITKKETTYRGLPAHPKITFQVPLVFGDGGRIFIGTNGAKPLNAGAPADPLQDNNLWNYDANAPRKVEKAFDSTNSA